MKKIQGKVLSGALATALTITNMGALMPMTALAATTPAGWTITDETENDSKTYVGEKYTVSYGLGNNTEDTFLALATVANDEMTLVKATDEAANSVSKEDESLSEAGTVTYVVLSHSEKITQENIANAKEVNTTAVEISTPKINSVTVKEENDAKYIPGKDIGSGITVTGNGASGLNLTATFAVDYQTAMNNIAFDIVDSDGESAGYSSSGNDFVGEVKSDDTNSTEISQIYNATVTAGSNITAGEYTFRGYIDENNDGKISDSEMLASYSFNVINDVVVYDEAMNNSIALDIGKTSQLTLYKDNEAVSSGITWTSGDEEKVSVSKKGLVTALKTTISGTTDTPVNIGAEYKIGNDLTFALEDIYAVTVNEEEVTTEQTVADAEVVFVDEDENPVTELEVGESAQAKAVYGDDISVSDVTWKSSNPSVLTIDSSTGAIKAVKNEGNSAINVTITASYYADGTNYTKTKTIAVNPLTYIISINGEVATGTTEIYEGKTATISIEKSTGAAFEDTITWKSSNEKIATVDSNGLIEIVEGAASISPATTVITPMIGSSAVTTGITIKAVEYEKEIVVDTDKDNVYYGDSANLSATYEDEDGNTVDISTSGIWKIDTDATNGAVTLTGNVAKVTGDGTGEVVVEFYETEADVEDNTYVPKSVTITVLADAFEFYLEDELEETLTTAGTITFDIDNMEVGESRKLSTKFGSQDVTNKTTWSVKSGSALVSVDENGSVKANAEGINAVIKGVYKLNSDEYTVEVTVKQILAETGALELANTAIEQAGVAYKEAGSAVTSAATAQELAEATLDDPTEENLAEAKEALDAANESLSAAEKAYETAKENYDSALAAGAKSDDAKDAVLDAKDAVDAAKDAVDAAKKAVSAAEVAYEEANDVVTEVKIGEAIDAAEKAADAAVANPTDETIKAANDAVAAAKELGATDAELKTATDKIAQAEAAKKAADEKAADEKAAAEQKAAEEKAAAEKVAAQATGATGTDSASGNTYKVTDGSSKTVAITKAASNASGKVTIPSTVTISGDQFTVTEISANAFKGNKKINQVVIPKTVTKIGKNAFKNCSKVKKVVVKANKNLTVGKNAFKGLKKGSKIVVKGLSGSAKKKLVKKISKQVTSSRTTVK